MPLGRAAHQPVDVLIVDADPGQRRALAGLITERAVGRFLPRSCASPAEAIAQTRPGGGSIMIADLETIGGTQRLHEMGSARIPLIATSAASSLTVAVAAVKAGAVDFMPKPIGAKGLIERLEAAMSAWSGTQGTSESQVRQHAQSDFAGFIGASPAMREVYDHIRQMAPSRAPVFISGESGTGKEICADAIHTYSGSPGRPFVAINCSAIPKELMESEIFGHVRGAFTGATDNRTGAAEVADGGTLFLDEIAEMDLSLQAKILRFVQTGSFRRVGGTELKRVDVRIISATNRDPFVEVEAGRFRADLFYRLHVLPIHMPPLRARGGDIIALANAFLARFSTEEGRAFRGFDPETTARILASSWPGNVRQLENVVRRIVVLYDSNEVTAAMLPAGLAASAETLFPHSAETSPAAIRPYWEQERQIIEGAVAAFAGNIARAAGALEIAPSTIYRKRLFWSGRPSA